MRIKPSRALLRMALVAVVAMAALWALRGLPLDLLRSLGKRYRPEARVVTVVDTVPVAQWRRQAERWRAATEAARADLEGERGKLRQAVAALGGRVVRQPARIVVTDTVVLPAPPQFLVDRSGELSLAVTTPDSAGDLVGVTATGIQIGDCDDGIRVSAGARPTVICDRPRLGHARLFAGAGAAASLAGVAGPAELLRDPPAVAALLEAGAEWIPRYRSAWSVELRGELALGGEPRAALVVRRRLPLW